MANQFLYPLKGSRGRAIVLCTGVIAPQGTSQPTVTADGRAFTVARGGVGTFTITFSQRYTALRRATFTVGGLLPNVVRAGTFTSNGTGGVSTLTFSIKADGTAAAADADIAAGANNLIFVDFLFRDTGLAS